MFIIKFINLFHPHLSVIGNNFEFTDVFKLLQQGPGSTSIGVNQWFDYFKLIHKLDNM